MHKRLVIETFVVPSGSAGSGRLSSFPNSTGLDVIDVHQEGTEPIVVDIAMSLVRLHLKLETLKIAFIAHGCTFCTDDELVAENRRLKELHICRICMDLSIDTVFLPCGHLVCCSTCSHALRNCPICRSLIRGTVKAFFS